MSTRTEQQAGPRIAILVASGVEQTELLEPLKALENAGLASDIVSPEKGAVTAWNRTDWGDEFDVDVPLERARAEDYDILFLPGAVMNPDALSRNRTASRFVSAFFASGKPVGALCHGPRTLPGGSRGREITSYRSVLTDVHAFVSGLSEADDAERPADDRPPAAGTSAQMIVWLRDTRKRVRHGRQASGSARLELVS